MNHPFQRGENPPEKITTPFQRELVARIRDAFGDVDAMSGRRLSSLLGKSANHVSLMLNGGFVPSGQSVLELAEVLGLDQRGTDRLVRAAMTTKAGQRSRDGFWLTQSQRMLEEAERERDLMLRFLDLHGLREACLDFVRRERDKEAASGDGGPDVEGPEGGETTS